MADNTARSARRSRVPGGSRNSSARSSAALNSDALLQPPGYPSLALHPSSSRFSLNEQFSRTRHDFEFGFDDTSSILETATTVSEAMGEHHDDGDTVVIGPLDDPDNALSVLRKVGDRNHYDLLCVPQAASADEMRRAYYRLFLLLYPELHPLKLRNAAELCFSAVQNAFETLVNPRARVGYDVHNAVLRKNTVGLDEDFMLRLYSLWHAELLRHQLLHQGIEEEQGHLELGFISYDAEPLNGQSTGPYPYRNAVLRPLGFSMGQSFTVTLPAVGDFLNRISYDVQARLKPDAGRGAKTDTRSEYDAVEGVMLPASLDIRRTSLTVRGSVYSLLGDSSLAPVPSYFFDLYQPAVHNGVPLVWRLMQRHDSQVQPAVSIKFQHQLIPPTNSQENLRGPYTAELEDVGTIVELESELIPDPALAARISRRVVLPYDSKPSMLQIAAKAPLRHLGLPRIGVAIQRPIQVGLLQCRVESGSWISERLACHPVAFFSRLYSLFMNRDVLAQTSPKVELAYKWRGSFKPSATCFPSRAAEVGIRDLDWNMDRGGQETCTMSVTAEPHCLGCVIKFAEDITIPSLQSLGMTSKPQLESRSPKHNPGRKIRVETELSKNTMWVDYLALRCLKHVGRFSKVGVEVALSRFDLHFSLYWSRLGQSIRIPFLLSSDWAIHSPLPWVVFCSCVAGLFARRLISDLRSRDTAKLPQPDVRKIDLQSRDERHKEADEIKYLLAANVQSNQDAERVKGGLVILSAYYAVKPTAAGKTSTDDRVVDVTVAVAALVDKGKLYIPSDVCKNNLLGFWDPDPSAQKILRVCYLFQGKEGTVEVNEEDELRLPPVS